MKELRKELQLIVVAPGFVETPMTAAIPEDVKQGMINSIPVKRIGLPMLICS